MQNIHNSCGSISVKSLYDWCGISQRQLEKRFINAAGASPKHFTRITRFLNVCKQIRMRMKQGVNIHLTHITQEFGYFDQSHFIREFKVFSGVTPKEFLSNTDISFVEI